jgi:oxygen-independent coproporphyrinogen III oxidase
MNAKALIQKYNQPGPRYTSYPPVPFWKIDHWEKSDWIETIKKGQLLPEGTAISIYVHLPYCESLCTFCGCHKYITTNHSVEQGYIDTVLKEWEFIASQLDANTSIAEIHLGGGTPTFFAPSELKRLIDGLTSHFPVLPNTEMSFEAHPNSTSSAHLEVLSNCGFRRVSFGIQDYDPFIAFNPTNKFPSAIMKLNNLDIRVFRMIWYLVYQNKHWKDLRKQSDKLSNSNQIVFRFTPTLMFHG